MKILIAVDMEGITGVFNWKQADEPGPDYERYRRILTEDVNAAVRGAFQGGADEVVVSDGHARCDNILIDELDPRARLVGGVPSEYGMVHGIDSSVDGVLLVGYHGRAGSLNAVLDHTVSSRCIANVWLNDLLVGEIGLSSALCGFYGAATIMISGDQTACAEAVDLLGEVETAVVKKALGRGVVDCLPPEITHRLIFQAAEKAVARLVKGKAPAPFTFSGPVALKVEFNFANMADSAALMPSTTRIDGRTIEVHAKDMPEAYRAVIASVALARPYID